MKTFVIFVLLGVAFLFYEVADNLNPNSSFIPLTEEEVMCPLPGKAQPEESNTQVNAATGDIRDAEVCAWPEMNARELGYEILQSFNAAWLKRQETSKPEIEEIIPVTIEGKVEKGDTLSKILDSSSANEIHSFISAAKKVFPLSSFRIGQPYQIISDPQTGKIKRFEYEVNDRDRLVIEGDENSDKPEARLEKIKYLTTIEVIHGTIDDNLFKAVADIDESPQLALRLVELFGSEINFIKDLQEGDNFTVLLEKRFREDESKGYGRLLAARFVNKNKVFEAFLYPDSNGLTRYYNARGENLKKTLLQAPLEVTRLTSRFTHSRKHPISGIYKPHLGVDYGAPTGTPIKAVGAGVVIKRGWAGGYGNQIIIKHSSGLDSHYSHLSRFASGIKVGQKVRQGQTIGFVGSTGISTGPHLDFRLSQNGKFINPTKAINPREKPLDVNNMARFKVLVKKEKAWLDGKRLPQNYTVDTIVPLRIEDQKPTVKRASNKERTGKRS